MGDKEKLENYYKAIGNYRHKSANLEGVEIPLDLIEKINASTIALIKIQNELKNRGLL